MKLKGQGDREKIFRFSGGEEREEVGKKEGETKGRHCREELKRKLNQNIVTE